ncbi:IclR family transcriptional regulator [Paucilactobacillus hokkaidonensis JCM 18461]|uniref:IclR family transcriptional regulator n=2 Tax=Paucilactobacillus hokkaidonensis TaxID=1193095 RepID=A0A0A1H007_9LACO|nr:IclR family transcriptional regulator [Paucilactobacillus hokkaidonensis]KRO08879.1 IclR family transcriptional regulator [Paucilactobacillus hokkaidonensis]BAP86588.1 IclR family transcriptional regulator [Paucilactobacillus hokkaidonensis JCM 18461]
METKLYGSVLIKAAQILDVLGDGKSKTIHEISTVTGITPPTVSKILTTLVYIGYVSKARESKEYFLGTKLIQFGNVKTDTTSLIEITQPFLQMLQSEIDETVHFAVPRENEVVYVNKIEPKNQNIYMTSKIGLTRPLYSSGIGKAVLSTYDDTVINDYLATTKLIPFTDHTITTPQKLLTEIKKIRKQGFSIDDEEQEKDMYCVATYIKQADITVGALSISLPKFRMTEAYRNKIIKAILDIKVKIETEINS